MCIFFKEINAILYKNRCKITCKRMKSCWHFKCMVHSILENMCGHISLRYLPYGQLYAIVGLRHQSGLLEATFSAHGMLRSSTPCAPSTFQTQVGHTGKNIHIQIHGHIDTHIHTPSTLPLGREQGVILDENLLICIHKQTLWLSRHKEIGLPYFVWLRSQQSTLFSNEVKGRLGHSVLRKALNLKHKLQIQSIQQKKKRNARQAPPLQASGATQSTRWI